MQCFFNTCEDAIRHAVATKTFGLYYSEATSTSLQMHVHDCCEIFLSLSEGNSFLIDDKVYAVNANDLFIINQFEAHKVSYSNKDKFVRFSLHVHPTFLYSNSMQGSNLAECFYDENKIKRLSLTTNETKELTALFYSLRTEYDYGDELYKRIRATEILLTVNRLYASHNEKTGLLFHHKAVQLAIEYINNNFAQELTLENVAKNAYVSVNQLCRLFHRYCSTTVMKYITSKRITHAKKLLSEGKNVTDTAFACGFNDYANFIRVFKNAVGVPPGKYKSETE